MEEVVEKIAIEKYPAYKDSGVEWLGQIPEHWEVTSVKHLLSIPITDGPHTTPELLDEGIPFISAESIKNGEIDFEKKRGYISIKDHLLFTKKYRPKRKDIYMVKSGATTGNIAMLKFDFDFSIWSPLAVFRTNFKLVPEYLYYFLQSNTFKEGVELSWSFGTQQNIGMGILSNLPIAYCSINEQTAISNFLDNKTSQIDKAIRIKEKQIELLKERRQILIHNAVTKGLNYDLNDDMNTMIANHSPSKNQKNHSSRPMKDSGVEWIGEIPEGWEVKRIKHVTTKIGSGITPSGGGTTYLNFGIPLLRSQNILFGKIELENVAYISGKTHDSMNNSKVIKGDVLLNITGGSIGRCHYVETDFPMNVNQHVCIIRPLNIITSVFLNSLLASEIGQGQIWFFQQGGGREGLNFQAIKNFIIPLPPRSEQLAISEYLERTNQKFATAISLKGKEIEKLKEYKATLINSAVTGKIKAC